MRIPSVSRESQRDRQSARKWPLQKGRPFLQKYFPRFVREYRTYTAQCGYTSVRLYSCIHTENRVYPWMRDSSARKWGYRAIQVASRTERWRTSRVHATRERRTRGLDPRRAIAYVRSVLVIVLVAFAACRLPCSYTLQTGSTPACVLFARALPRAQPRPQTHQSKGCALVGHGVHLTSRAMAPNAVMCVLMSEASHRAARRSSI